MATCRGRGRLPGSWSRPLFRRQERTRCRSLFCFCPFLRGLGRLGTQHELHLPPSKPFRPPNPVGIVRKYIRMQGHAWGVAVVLGTAPSLFLLSFFSPKVRCEPEPLRHIAMAFGLGLYAMVAARGMAAAVAGLLPAGWPTPG